MVYGIVIDSQNRIIGYVSGNASEGVDDYIVLSYDEYLKSRQSIYFDLETRTFSGIREQPVVPPTHEELTEQTNTDVLMSMEMEVDTNTKVSLSQEDGLLIMEALLQIQEMLTTPSGV